MGFKQDYQRSISLGEQFSIFLLQSLCLELMEGIKFYFACWEGFSYLRMYVLITTGPESNCFALVLLKEMRMRGETKISLFCFWC